MYRPIKDDPAVVVQQRRRGIDGKESAVKAGMDHVLKNDLVGRAAGCPAGDASVGEDESRTTSNRLRKAERTTSRTFNRCA